MDSTNREEAPQATDRRTAVEQVLYGETDTRLRATWRILFAVAVFIGLVIIGETIFSAADVQPVITELKLPYLAALAGTVVVAVRLGDRSVSSVEFDINAVWFRDLAAGIGLGLIFQFAVPSSGPERAGSQSRTRRSEALRRGPRRLLSSLA